MWGFEKERINGDLVALFLKERKENEKPQSWKKTGSVSLGAQAEQKETQLHHRQASVRGVNRGEIIHNYRQSCFRG